MTPAPYARSVKIQTLRSGRAWAFFYEGGWKKRDAVYRDLPAAEKAAARFGGSQTIPVDHGVVVWEP